MIRLVSIYDTTRMQVSGLVVPSTRDAHCHAIPQRTDIMKFAETYLHYRVSIRADNQRFGCL